MNIGYIRRYLMSQVGKHIVLIYHGGRNHNERYEGILYNIYNNIFTIRLCNGVTKSFSYADILTKTVQISI